MLDNKFDQQKCVGIYVFVSLLKHAYDLNRNLPVPTQE